MCTSPIEQDGKVFACRTCNACIATRKAGWIARAMAEKALWPHTFCVALTYDNSTQENRDAAAFFQYSDVRAFLKRVLRAANYRQPGSTVRFICAGEQGDLNGRCHWHLILYSDVDLTTLGLWSDHAKAPIEGRAAIVSEGDYKKRVHWSLWGRGFLTVQEPDQGGMAYVLSYCLKDQFTLERSKGTMREADAENFATGLFRMSKRPAIGEAWLFQRLASLAERGECLPAIKLKVPEMSGYWVPGGNFRKALLWGLVALNKRIVWTHGRDAAQWSSLFKSCEDLETDLEILRHGEKEKPPLLDETSFEAELRRRGEEYTRDRRISETVAKCGGLLPCFQCLNGFDTERLEALRITRVFGEDGGCQYETHDPEHSVADYQERRGAGINPYCVNKEGAAQREAFPRSNPAP